MAMTPGRWSISALAVEFGMDRRTIASRLKEVTPAGQDGRAKVYRMSDAARAVYGPTDSDGQNLDVTHETARLKKAQADKTELEVKVLRGDLFEGDQVLKVWTDQIMAARAKLVGLPSIAAVRVVGLDLGETESELRDLVYQALDELKPHDPTEYSKPSKRPDVKGGEDVGTATGSKRKPVGRRKKGAVKRVKRGAGKLAN